MSNYREIYEDIDRINSTPCPDNAEVLSKGSFYVPAKYASDEILTENAVLANVWGGADQSIETKNGCPDCKDGFYHPFAGPPEPCQTCKPTDVIQDPCCNDFKNLLLERLKNIDLSPIKVVSGFISNPAKCSINLIVRDGELSRTIDDYYEYFSARIRQDFENHQVARLDFTDAKILTTYHVPTSGVLMSFFYRRAPHHVMP